MRCRLWLFGGYTRILILRAEFSCQTGFLADKLSKLALFDLNKPVFYIPQAPLHKMSSLKKVFALMKKAKDQPVIFHMLHSHLAYVVRSKKHMQTEGTDLWERILVASVEDPKISRASLEAAILKYLKGSRRKVDGDTFKLKIILYYMDSKMLAGLNMFILFELMTYHYNITPLTDALIDSIVAKSFLSKIFGIKSSKRLSDDAALLFLKTNNTFSHKRLPAYIHFDLEPPLVEYGSKSRLMEIKVLESLSLYANYTRNVDYFKSIIPQTKDFLDMFKKFVCRDPEIFLCKKSDFDIKKLKLENGSVIDELKNRIRRVHNMSSDKLEFKASIINFVNNI